MSFPSFRRFSAALIGLLLAGVLWWVLAPPFLPATAPELQLQEARAALRNGRHDVALQAAQTVPSSAEEFSEAQLIVGEILTRRRDYEAALAAYAKVSRQQTDAWVAAQYCTGDLWFHLGYATQAESSYRRVLQIRPDDLPTHEQLATLLGMFGRRWESRPHLFVLVRNAIIHSETRNEALRLLGNPDAALALPPHLKKFEERAPDDPLPILVRARHALLNERRAEAEALSRQVVRLRSDLIEGWAVLGLSLTDGPSEAIVAWNAELPPGAEAFPDIWIARGLWEQSHGERSTAVRCFAEAVRRAPDSRRANYHLGQSLLLLQPPSRELAAPFLAQAERLAELEAAYQVAYLEPQNAEAMRQISETTESAGRYWESVGWAQLAMANRPSPPTWAIDRIRRLRPHLTADVAQHATGYGSISEFPIANYPLPMWGSVSHQAGSLPTGVAEGRSIRWDEDSAAAGIEFHYFNGSEPAREGKLIFQSLGGGLAALDYDGDHWPDLYFAQGSHWPAEPDLAPVIDRLYRNRGDGRFDDVTRLAGLGDSQFTNGVAVGDINDDGFADVYLGNAGLNVLYENCGDGTFLGPTERRSLEEEQLTLSVLIADLNGDGAPELFDVNYVSVPEGWTRICRANGATHPCSPRLMASSFHRVWQNLGDGRFADVSESAGLRAAPGKGMGITGFDPEGTGNLHLFVTNDTMPNSYFVNQPDEATGTQLRLRDDALATGLAFDGDGRTFACMGIAADDIDGDGRLDLFVTNFYDEPNTLYRQVSANLFDDGTRQFGLYTPSLSVLGFGTQFVDAELDGWPDLIVANGHIDDYSSRGIPYAMPAHCYHNRSGMRFELVDAGGSGPYFERPHLGRGVARLDWNRDGAEDVAISHLDEPAALLTNRSIPRGHFLAVRLVGTRAARDAHGIAVDVFADGRNHRRQLVAGGGYASTNEAQLVFGLGDAETVETLTVRWPQSGPQTFSMIPSDRHVLLIEGRADLVFVP